MSANIREDEMQHAELFGKPILFTNWLVPRDTVPEGWYCYDLRGADKTPAKPATLEDKVVVNHAGTVLSPVPLKKPSTGTRRINGQFYLQGETMNLERFCEEHGLEYPQETRKYMLRPASPHEAGLFYSNEGRDQELACVGHLRMDFGHSGQEFWPTWWEHNGDALTVPAFKAELDEVVNELRERGPLKDLAAMSSYCHDHSQGALEGGSYGFIAESEGYRYCLRCTPRQDDYNGYLYAYDKRRQELAHGLTETGRQLLRDAANPSRPHDYDWFVFEDINTAQERLSGGLSLEDAVARYQASGSGDKRLGVTKDGIATVDLAITQEGIQRFCEDYKRLDSVSADPIVAQAVETLRQELREAPEQNMIQGGMQYGG